MFSEKPLFYYSNWNY